MTSVVDKIRQLILLATDPSASEAEARTSAHLACNLIRKHGLWSEMRSYVAPEPEKKATSPMKDPVRIRSKYSGFCAECGCPYDVGDWIYWMRGTRPIHATCPDVA